LFLRGVSDSAVFARLGVGDVERSSCTLEEALRRYSGEPGKDVVCVARAGEWCFLLEIHPSGRLFTPDSVSSLSTGGEAVGAWHLLDSTTRAVHACDGEVLGYYDDWLSLVVEGAAPERLFHALGAAGVLEEDPEDDGESEDFSVASVTVLAAVEEEFGLRFPVNFFDGPWATVELP
jgi:hypothetical protein